MSAHFSFKFLLSIAAVAMLSLTLTSDASAQRGFRIGNVMQAGGGQGFRLGGQRAGMHFGGGQGASIGTQNFGMRFGNGQGARFGGQQYGMQFGGQQGTQIGQFATRPTVAPGTYYYGDVPRGGSARPVVGQPAPRIAQQPGVYSQPVASGNPAMIPTVAQPNSNVVQTQANVDVARTPELNAPATGVGNGTQLDIAAAPSEPSTRSQPLITAKESAETSASTTVITQTSKKVSPGVIRLRHAADATGDMKYELNGTEFTLTPGESVMMTTGTDWTVKFSAGDAFGGREAKLSEAGTFSFEETVEEGWVIVEDQPVAPPTASEETKYETSEVAEMLTTESKKSESAEPIVPNLDKTPKLESPDSTEIQLDAPAANEDGNSVLKIEEPVTPADIAPAKSPEGDK